MTIERKEFEDRIEWWLNGQRHRADGPACEWADGSKTWWLNGRRHRADGPACEWFNGTKKWWVNGVNITRIRHALARLYRRRRWRRFVRQCARRWALKCAIEWRPPRGVQFAAMMEGMDGSL